MYGTSNIIAVTRYGWFACERYISCYMW